MYKKKITLALVGFVSLALSGIAGAVDTRTRFMAANCSYCHGPDGKSHGAIPSLAGREPGYFVEQMKAFREGSRPATVMKKHAAGYTDAEFEAMAKYFATIK